MTEHVVDSECEVTDDDLRTVVDVQRMPTDPNMGCTFRGKPCQ